MVKLVTDTNLTASVNAAVAALVAGAPGALDTLNELAAALGDDANFAATVTAALGNRLVWRGAWAPATNYVTNDVVTFNGGLYRAPNNFTSGGAFVLANWVELHAQTGTYALPTAVQTAVPSSPTTGQSWLDTASPVAVCFTFDDNRADQMAIVDVLSAYSDARATFFMNSGRFYGHVAAPDTTYMTIGDAQKIASLGHEIGGHTLTHNTFTGQTVAAVLADITADRNNLINWGLGDLKSFAYPYTDDAFVRVLKDAGYSLGRLGAQSSNYDRFVPSNKFAITLRGETTTDTTTLAGMQAYVTAARGDGGGVVGFVTHGHDGGAGNNGLSLTVLDQFCAWCFQNGIPMLTMTEVFGS